ncbi:hypothetical protein YC2023_036251 [Brassica napus]
MKRERSEYEESIKNLDIVKCLMILSRTSIVKQIGVNQFTERNTSNRFECKTCNRRFSSFQALGGHRASHKKPKLTVDEKDVKHLTKNYKGTHMHKCSRCGQSFGTGQALGGHMRRHRSSMTLEPSQRISPVIPTMPVMKLSWITVPRHNFSRDIQVERQLYTYYHMTTTNESALNTLGLLINFLSL